MISVVRTLVCCLSLPPSLLPVLLLLLVTFLVLSCCSSDIKLTACRSSPNGRHCHRWTAASASSSSSGVCSTSSWGPCLAAPSLVNSLSQSKTQVPKIYKLTVRSCHKWIIVMCHMQMDHGMHGDHAILHHSFDFPWDQVCTVLSNSLFGGRHTFVTAVLM